MHLHILESELLVQNRLQRLDAPFIKRRTVKQSQLGYRCAYYNNDQKGVKTLSEH